MKDVLIIPILLLRKLRPGEVYRHQAARLEVSSRASVPAQV